MYPDIELLKIIRYKYKIDKVSQEEEKRLKKQIKFLSDRDIIRYMVLEYDFLFKNKKNKFN